MPNTYTELRKTTVGTATASVTLDLTGISGYTDLVLVVEGIATANSTSSLSLQFNGDTASNYSGTRLSGNGSTATSDRYSTATVMGGGLITSSVRFNNIINIQNYSNTTTFKTVLFRSNVSDSLVRTSVNLWRSTAAITQIDVLATATTFASGTTISLYGIANADQGAAKATGGIITEDSQYWYHTFGASGAFVPKQSLTCDVLVVAGGGGGGTRSGGGGGAGGLLAFTSQALSATNYTVTVGAGGAGAAVSPNTASGTVGADSQFQTLTLVKGGGFGGGATVSGGTGGSGGGAGNSAGASSGGTASPSGQGNNGGASNFNAGAGGGGAGAVGGVAANNVAGNGGNGTDAYSSWFIPTGLGVSGFIAGGGGGGCNTTQTQSIGGSGGGGRGSNGVSALAGTAGTTNTGGGGGGGGVQSNGVDNTAGGAGGSGVVIVRYAK
jgi:hypothetical protein